MIRNILNRIHETIIEKPLIQASIVVGDFALAGLVGNSLRDHNFPLATLGTVALVGTFVEFGAASLETVVRHGKIAQPE